MMVQSRSLEAQVRGCGGEHRQEAAGAPKGLSISPQHQGLTTPQGSSNHSHASALIPIFIRSHLPTAFKSYYFPELVHFCI